MIATTTTNQIFDTKSALWEELSDAQAQSASGGLAAIFGSGGVTFSLQGLPSGNSPVRIPVTSQPTR
ncbi:hypothetical protein [Iningainema tapete]|uniref:Uncharacterized protein n=1 Tax=Iningainema tapete BLCC-T55 TaxID=2748662 RepID=A0A8J6XJH5_9CYAN|nr:hypothetical protein [Iningainema tapete]MBD2777144.1 hypothetical protein [Iningainema tapete BLCC-T55]